MENSYYKQPITADNIEIALLFHIKVKHGFGYKLGSKVSINRLVEQCAAIPELSSMHDVVMLLDNDLQYIPKAVLRSKGIFSERNEFPYQVEILDILIAANFPCWELQYNIQRTRFMAKDIRHIKSQLTSTK